MPKDRKKDEPQAAQPPTHDEYLSRFSDVYKQARQLEGKPIPVKDLIGKEFVVTKCYRRRSQYKQDEEYAAVQIDLDGAKYYFNTSSGSLMDQLQRTEGGMPYRAKLETKTSSTGRKYLTLS